MPANHATNSRQEKNYDFKPVDYDIEDMAPDAFPGDYEAVLDDVKINKTNKDQYPMLVLEWKLDTALDQDDESCKKSEGATLSDFIVFFPPGHKGDKMSKLRLRTICTTLGIDWSVVPKQIRAKSDFDDLVGALKGQRMNLKVVMKMDSRSGEEVPGINYPKSTVEGEETEEPEEEQPAPRAKAAAKPAAKGKGARR